MRKFKKLTAILMSAVLLICAAPLNGIADTDWSEFALTASALDASGSLGYNVTYTYNSETGEVVISGKGKMKGYSSPSSSPFFELKVKSVVIEDGVTSIGGCVFYGCTSLISVTIPDSMASIGSDAFYGCTSLESITIPDSITSIYNRAFSYCTSLESIPLGNGVTSIGLDAFYNTAYYSDANNWENGVLYIGNYLIEANKGLAGDYTIKSGTKVIADNAFYDTKLTSITIPDSVTIIGNSAFSGCTSLTSVNITDIASWCNISYPSGAYPFSYPLFSAARLYLNGEIITELIIPENVTSIPEFAFYGCTDITSVTIPNSVTTIGDSAFADCSGLTNIELPDSVTKIGGWAFSGCTSLTNVELSNSIKIIYPMTFFNCTSLKSIIIPDGVVSIDTYAFRGCTSLESMIIPDTLTNISLGAFKDCIKFYSGHYRGTQEQWQAVTVERDGNIEFIYDVHMEDMIFDETIAPTCTESGYAEGYKCSLCDFTIEDPQAIVPLGHDYSEEWKIDKDVTCTEDGSMSHHCSRCDSKTDVTAIEAEGHTEETIPAVPATCTSTGLTEEIKCSVCGEILVEQTVTEKIPHTMGEWTTTQAPACTETGEEKRDCVNCDYYETNILSATGHAEETIPAVPATCTSTGLTEGAKCSVCGEILVEQTVTEKISHSYKAVVTAATCTTGGYTTCTCSVCGDSYTDAETQALGHKMGEFTVIKISTCTENGEEISECSRCDYSETQEISATGHNYENGVCANCGDNKTENCSCNCHKSGFIGFIWKILNFFYKIFGTNKICDCGIAHY